MVKIQTNQFCKFGRKGLNGDPGKEDSQPCQFCRYKPTRSRDQTR
jgi:hypothetical protein